MTLSNNVFYIKNIRKTSCFYSVGVRVLGRTFLVSHTAYDKAVSIALFAVTMIAPVAAIAMEQL